MPAAAAMAVLMGALPCTTLFTPAFAFLFPIRVFSAAPALSAAASAWFFSTPSAAASAQLFSMPSAAASARLFSTLSGVRIPKTSDLFQIF